MILWYFCFSPYKILYNDSFFYFFYNGGMYCLSLSTDMKYEYTVNFGLSTALPSLGMFL